MNLKALHFAIALAISVGAALAEPTMPPDAPVVDAASQTDDQLRDAVTGKMIYLNISGFELPIRYKANGRMTGTIGAVAATFSRGDGSRDTGRWWVQASQLCQRWTTWMEGQTYCYKLTRQGNRITWIRHDGVSGAARIGESPSE
jgi:hypothetical protein